MKTWLDWRNYHAEAFGFSSDKDLFMLANWTDAFAARGFTPAEMFAASQAMLVGTAPTWRPDQRNALVTEVIKARKSAQVGAPCVALRKINAAASDSLSPAEIREKLRQKGLVRE